VRKNGGSRKAPAKKSAAQGKTKQTGAMAEDAEGGSGERRGGFGKGKVEAPVTTTRKKRSSGKRPRRPGYRGVSRAFILKPIIR